MEDVVEAGQGRKGMEMRVVHQTRAKAMSRTRRALEQVEGPVRVARTRIAASGVVESRKIVLLERDGLFEPLAASLKLTQRDQRTAGHIKRANVIGTVLQHPIGRLDRALERRLGSPGVVHPEIRQGEEAQRSVVGGGEPGGLFKSFRCLGGSWSGGEEARVGAPSVPQAG